MDKQYIIQLLQRYFTNQATHAEREALFAEVEKYKNNEDWEELLASVLPQVEEIKEYNPQHYQSIIDTVLGDKGRQEHMGARGPLQETPGRHTKVIPIYRRSAFKWIAAASIIIIASIVVMLSLSKHDNGATPSMAKTNDIPAPSNTRAVITLADGSKVYLDSAENGTIANENNVAVVKNANGEIIYSPDHQITRSPDISYNTLYNPRGSKVISLTLSDGTKVWLNSESSLKYPIAFTSNTREVEITGEAYFEVQHNAKQPFKVHLPNGSIVEDIGTAFNVNAYNDEASIKTTLIEGSVRILSPDHQITKSPNNESPDHQITRSPNNESPDHQITKSQILKPGEQLVQSPDHQITRSPDIDEVTAWKTGLFHFESADLKTILKEFSRWYDIEVIYEGTISNEKYFTIIRRTTSLTEVLKSLQANNIQFRIEGKKLFVTSG